MNRIFTLITMCVFTIGAAFAEETTIDFVSLYNSDKSVQPATPITSGAFSFSYERVIPSMLLLFRFHFCI